MKTVLILLFLAACGDNWIPASPDAGGGEAAIDASTDAATTSDGRPDEFEIPECTDPHTGNGKGHERNCWGHERHQH